MNRVLRNLLAAVVILAPIVPGSSGSTPVRRAQTNPNRIAFQIAAIEETGGGTKTISRSIVEGPPGTDFSVLLEGSPTQIEANFLTDAISDSELRLRAKVKTDRLYGYSERKLPLYEEAKLADDFRMGFDEAIRLYPFGQDGTDTLRIEITPVRTTNPVYDSTGAPAPLSIKALEVTAANPVSLRARKQPHHFSIHATLLEDGIEVGAGTAECLLEEASDILIAPSSSRGEPLTLHLNVDQYTRDRPADNITVTFNLYRGNGAASKDSPLALDWAGVASLGSPMNYDLSDIYPGASGHKVSLKLLISVAPGEIVY